LSLQGFSLGDFRPHRREFVMVRTLNLLAVESAGVFAPRDAAAWSLER
jgi:hypothetical protein